MRDIQNNEKRGVLISQSGKDDGSKDTKATMNENAITPYFC